MRAALAITLLLALAPGARANLGDVDTALREVAFDEVQISPDGNRLAFLTRGNDFQHDREVSALWMLDLSGPARPIRLEVVGDMTDDDIIGVIEHGARLLNGQ